MSIWKKVTRRNVQLGFIGKTKVSILKEMSEAFAPGFSEEQIILTYEALLAREKLSSTAIGAGIAIPHARLEHIKSPHVLIAKSDKGVKFDAIDEKKVHLIFCVLSPLKDTEGHLKLLARVSKFLHDTSFREQLLQVETEQDLLNVIDQKDANY